MSIYGYGYGTNDGQNALDWDYYRYPEQQAGARPLDYPAHLPWPPPQNNTGGSDYVEAPAPKDTRTDYQRFYDYVDSGKFGVSDRAVTQGLGMIMPGGSIIMSETDKDYGVPGLPFGLDALMPDKEGFQSRYGENYFGPGSKYSAAMGYTGQERQDALDKFTGLHSDQSLTDATRVGAHLTEDGVNYINSLPLSQQTQELNTLGIGSINAKGEMMANSQRNTQAESKLALDRIEVDNLQAQVNQAKGIGTLSAEKDNFGNSNPLGIPSAGRGFTSVEGIQNLGTASTGYEDNLGTNLLNETSAIDTFNPDNNFGYGGSQVDSSGNSANFGWSGGTHGDGSSGPDSSGGFGGFEDGTDASDEASADQGYW